MSDTMTPQSWADEFLTELGDNVNPTNEEAVEGWEAGEGGAGPEWGTNNLASFNPINSTLAEPGSVKVNSDDVQAYTSWEQGLDASVATLEESQTGYATIRNDLANGASVDQTNADIDASKWGTHDLPTGGATSTTTSAPWWKRILDPGAVAAGEPGAILTTPGVGGDPSTPGGAIVDSSGATNVLSLLGLSGTESDIAKIGVLIAGVVAGGGLIVLGAFKAISGTKGGQDAESAAKTGALAAAAS
jgi:hypothetical protein